MRKLEAVVNILLRCVFGGIGFFAVNSILQYMGVQALVGINAKTMATVGVLGFPGFLLLYAILLYHTSRPS